MMQAHWQIPLWQIATLYTLVRNLKWSARRFKAFRSLDIFIIKIRVESDQLINLLKFLSIKIWWVSSGSWSDGPMSFFFFNAGTNHGLWEIGNNFEYQCQLTITSTVAVSVSAQWLAVALESGEIALFKGGPQRWAQHSQIPTLKGLKDLDYCYTSLLIHDKPQGWLRIFKESQRIFKNFK